MNKNKLIVATTVAFLFISSVVIFSCNKNGGDWARSNATSEELNTTSTIIPQAIIGYIDDNDQFVAITEQQLKTFFYEIKFISSNGVIKNYAVIEGMDSLSNPLYAVLAQADDGSSTVRMRFQLEKAGTNQYALTTGGCSCESTGCSAWGCNVSEFGPCSCSDCNDDNGTCKKTSTRLTKASIIAIFS